MNRALKMAPFISSLLLDSLYCQEQPEDLTPTQEPEKQQQQQQQSQEEEEKDWAELLSSLSAKELDMCPEQDPNGTNSSYLPSARQGMVDWVIRTCAHHGFSALTVLLAVNYLDRCFLGGGGGGGRSSLRLQEDRPWMGRLSAVACLSLAAKVEETHFPLLLDLQAAPPPAAAESAGYVFEPRTVGRMELLVLSALGWRMNPVTPLSFIHHLLPKLNTRSPNATMVESAHAILLSAIADERWVRYPPSVWAVSTLLHAMGQTVDDHQTNHLLSILDLSKGRVEECCGIISESMGIGVGVGIKRKYKRYDQDYYLGSPLSPDGVINSCFSCESSINGCDHETWALWGSSVSPSPEIPPYKRPNSSIDEEDDA